MAKSLSVKSKPWIPPGTNICKNKNEKPTKRTAESKKSDPVSSKPSKPSPKKTVAISEELKKDDAPKDIELDMLSLSSHSSYGAQNERDVHMFSILQEMKLLYIHFESLKTSYMSAHRLIDSSESGNINDLFIEAGACIRELNIYFDDLEYSVSVLENTLDENQKKQQYTKVFEDKHKLLSTLLNMYEKVIIIFESIFEKQDFKEMSQQQDSLNKKLMFVEKKCISQEAIIKDLERKVSIHQSKVSAMDSYKANLECAKADLEKQLQFKESHIQYLSSELRNASGMQKVSADHEEFIEIIEKIKSNAASEKSSLKKALKLQKSCSAKHEEKYQKLMQDFKEQEKMMHAIASQRDQVGVQLTVVSNNVIQQKNQIEELKIQKSKLQEEMAEQDSSHKKAITELQNSLEEKSSELDKIIKMKTKLEREVEELENELQKSKERFKSAKEERENQGFDLHMSKHSDKMYEQIQHLVSLLQNTKEVFENLKQSSHRISAAGDHATNDVGFDVVQSEILAAVKETKEHLQQLKNMCRTFCQEEKLPEWKDLPKNTDLEKQLKKMEKLYNAAVKENTELKEEMEELKNSSIASQTVQKNGNYVTTNVPNDNFTTKLQMELFDKNKDIRKIKSEFKQKENFLEGQLKEYRDKVQTLENDSRKVSDLEEELRNTKVELSTLQKKKEEETEMLLVRINELQDSLDSKNEAYESLENYVHLIKSSYRRVFEDS